MIRFIKIADINLYGCNMNNNTGSCHLLRHRQHRFRSHTDSSVQFSSTEDARTPTYNDLCSLYPPNLVHKKTQTMSTSIKNNSWPCRLFNSFRRRKSQNNSPRQCTEVSTKLNKKVSMSSMDLTILGEAHGMITDLLADSSLPLNVTGTLRIVTDMISPLLQHSMHRPSSISTPLLTVLEKNKNIDDEEQVKNQPDLKDDTPLSLKQRLQRNLGVSSRRMSSSYTTTTSATGMPTIDMEYHTKKSSNVNTTPNINSSLKRLPHRSKSHAGILTPSERNLLRKPRSFSSTTTRQLSKQAADTKKASQTEDTIFKVEIERGKPVYFEGMDDPSTDEFNESLDEINDHNKFLDRGDILLTGVALMGPSRTKLASMTERLDKVKETPEQEGIYENHSTDEFVNTLNEDFQTNSELQQNSQRCENNERSIHADCNDTNLSNSSRIVLLNKQNINSNDVEITPVQKSLSKDEMCGKSLIIPPNNARRKSSRELHLEYEIAVSNDISEMLNKVKDWDFPIFELSERCNVLTQLAFRIFQLCGFFKTFQIAEVTFLKFFRALESGYHNIPYHNRIHAADVLHGAYYFTQHRIPGFNGKEDRQVNNSEEIGESDYIESDGSIKEYSYGCICDAVPDLELMALYVAAAMHDFDHPGRTNAFLVATLNSKALLYNDRSVLENHHAAAAWSLLVTNPGLNFLSSLDPADFKRFRFIVIEEILSTDLKKHFDFLTEWNAKISEQGGGLNYSSEADRLLLGQMILKIADISGPSKEWDLHYRWTDRIVEEFYQQGEDERTLGMPTSAYMDRNSPKVPQLQSSFIKHLVQPLYVAYEKAGILPGEWVDVDEESSDDDDNSNSGDNYVEEKLINKKKIIYNVVTDNIAKNHAKWLKIIEEDDTNAELDQREAEAEDENEDDEDIEEYKVKTVLKE